MVIDSDNFLNYPILEIIEQHYYTGSILTTLLVPSKE